MTEQNRLAGETSPYLLQHADNPVAWYPWGAEALQRARQENKPILLSIGYSACHWCHVMAHESFEDPDTAAVMNRHFVNIKVDREERPDLDKIYQLAHNALTRRSGGWPLTMFLTPDRIPFFGGTYFPGKPRYGMPAFKDILLRVAEYHAENTLAIAQQNESLLSFFDSLQQSPKTGSVNTGALLSSCAESIKNAFDPLHGGFGEAPKFPQTTVLELALRLNADDPQLKHTVYYSLKKMIHGGLYDQLGGGFFRYSVDEQWQIPHFEKMLYDNGQLLNLLAQAWHVQRDADFARAIDETAGWLQREMQAEDGGFYSALDADSEGEEGRYYTWTPDRVRELLEPQTGALVTGCFGLDQDANFEDRWHLHLNRQPEDMATELDWNGKTARQQFDQARKQLLKARQQRVYPLRDDKILCSWNALAIKGLVEAGLLLGKPEYIAAASKALGFLQQTLWQNGRLLAVHCAGRSRFDAYLDDYAFLLDAVLRLLEAQWRNELFGFALQLADAVLQLFYDEQRRIFYFTAADHEQLIHRSHSLMDESTPSGAAIVARALLKLGYLSGETNYIETAINVIDNMAGQAARLPLAHASAVLAIIEADKPPLQLVLRGREPELGTWRQYARDVCDPSTSIYAIAADPAAPAFLLDKKALGPCTAYLCTGDSCRSPINDFAVFQSSLKETVT